MRLVRNPVPNRDKSERKERTNSMKTTTAPVISDGLWTLLTSAQYDCPCIRALVQTIRRLDRQPYHTRLLNPEMIGNFFAYREREGLISYMPAGREQLTNGDGRWLRVGRQEIKPARWLRSMLAPRLAQRFKDSDYAKFAEKFKAHELSGTIELEFVSFCDGYDSDNYYNGNPESCMTNEPIEGFYRCFPAKLLVAKRKDEKFSGRAIVWELDSGETFMDRVYAAEPYIEQLFLEHAQKNGWLRKTKQSSGNLSSVTRPDGSVITGEMSVTATESINNLDFYPYLDTFRWSAGKRIQNHDKDAEYVYECTGGNREEVEDPHEGEVQDVDGEWISEDDAVEVDGEWYHSDDERICYCDRCVEYHLRDGMYRVDVSRSETVTICSDYVTEL